MCHDFSALPPVGPRNVTGACDLHVIDEWVCVSGLINAMQNIREEMRNLGAWIGDQELAFSFN